MLNTIDDTDIRNPTQRTFADINRKNELFFLNIKSMAVITIRTCRVITPIATIVLNVSTAGDI